MTRTEAQLRKKFSAHKCDAKRRGIAFLLSFEQWLNIWKTSRRLNRRGCGRGCYVMARREDRGGYEIGNVEIILFEQNARAYRPTSDAKARTGAAHRGKIVSAATRKKLSQKAKARLYSLETRAKMSASARVVAKSKTRNENGRFA
jgi:hypothetical protein